MVVIGLENVLVLTKSVVSTPVDLEVKLRIAQGRGDWGRRGGATGSSPEHGSCVETGPGSGSESQPGPAAVCLLGLVQAGPSRLLRGRQQSPVICVLGNRAQAGGLTV